MIWLYDYLSRWNQEIYNNYVSMNDIDGEFVFSAEAQPSDSYWKIKLNKQHYIIEKEIKDKLPIKITDTKPIPWRNTILNRVIGYKSVRVTAERRMSVREHIDTFCDFKHTNPTQWLLLKFIAFTAMTQRINFRVCTDAGFGKDSIFNAYQAMTNNVYNVNPSSKAAIELRLISKLLVLNEMSNLKSDQRSDVQDFLLRAGDFSPTYEKSTRGNSGLKTKDIYNISELSIGILYNILDYYVKAAQSHKFFDFIFTKAVTDRFIPFKLSGELDIKQFDTKADSNEFMQHHDTYIDHLRTLEFYKEHGVRDEMRGYKIKDYKFTGRHGITFSKVADVVDAYANDQAEFDELIELLYQSYIDYGIMLQSFDGEELTKVEEEVIQ